MTRTTPGKTVRIELIEGWVFVATQTNSRIFADMQAARRCSTRLHVNPIELLLGARAKFIDGRYLYIGLPNMAFQLCGAFPTLAAAQDYALTSYGVTNVELD